MSTPAYTAVLIAIMSVVTILLRALPFLVFRKYTPEWLLYLGKVLPAAIIGMLVVYCLKDVKIQSAPYGLPELISALAVIGLQAWKRNSLISILSGTALYMVLIQLVF